MYFCINIFFTLLALSSTEAEYIGMYEASKLIMWLRQFLLELGFPPTSPTFLHEDNKSAIHIALFMEMTRVARSTWMSAVISFAIWSSRLVVLLPF